MLTNPEPDRNIDELSADEIYAAIRYLEPAPGCTSAQDADPPTGGQNHDEGVIICVCLYVAVLGCLAVLLALLAVMWFLARCANEIVWWIFGPGQHFCTRGDLWLAYRCTRIQCEHVDNAETSGSPGSSR